MYQLSGVKIAVRGVVIGLERNKARTSFVRGIVRDAPIGTAASARWRHRAPPSDLGLKADELLVAGHVERVTGMAGLGRAEAPEFAFPEEADDGVGAGLVSAGRRRFRGRRDQGRPSFLWGRACAGQRGWPSRNHRNRRVARSARCGAGWDRAGLRRRCWDSGRST